MYDQGDTDAARALAEKSLATVNDPVNTCEALYVLGCALSASQPRVAATVWGAVERFRQDFGLTFPRYACERHARERARAREAMRDDVAFDLAWLEGRAMTLDRALDFALKVGRAGATGSRTKL